MRENVCSFAQAFWTTTNLPYGLMYDLSPQPMNRSLRRWPSSVDWDKDSLCMYSPPLPRQESHYIIKEIMLKNMTLESECYSSTAIEKKLFLVWQEGKTSTKQQTLVSFGNTTVLIADATQQTHFLFKWQQSRPLGWERKRAELRKSLWGCINKKTQGC